MSNELRLPWRTCAGCGRVYPIPIDDPDTSGGCCGYCRAVAARDAAWDAADARFRAGFAPAVEVQQP